MHCGNVLRRILVLLWIYSTYNNGIVAETQLGDPYRILGVERKASAQEIRQAYRNLAKKWCVHSLQTNGCELIYSRWQLIGQRFSLSHTHFRHPDKSDDPLAESKFVEIKKAYELLSDNERRNAFDLHGVTNEDAFNMRNNHDYTQYGRFATDPFEEFFG